MRFVAVPNVPPNDLAFHPTLPIFASIDGPDIYLWNLETNKLVDQVPTNVEHGFSISFSPDGSRFAFAGETDRIRIFDVASRIETNQISGIGSVMSFAWNHDGTQMAFVDGEYPQHRVVICDPRTGQTIRKFEDLFKAVDVIWNWNSRLLAVCAEDRGIIIWDMETGILWDKYDGPTGLGGIGTAAVFRPDDKFVFSRGYGRFDLWDVETSTVEKVFDGRDQETSSRIGHPVAISSDGRLAAFEWFTVYVAELESGRVIMAEDGHAEGLSCMAFSPDGTKLATSDFEGVIHVWDMPQ